MRMMNRNVCISFDVYIYMYCTESEHFHQAVNSMTSTCFILCVTFEYLQVNTWILCCFMTVAWASLLFLFSAGFSSFLFLSLFISFSFSYCSFIHLIPNVAYVYVWVCMCAVCCWAMFCKNKNFACVDFVQKIHILQGIYGYQYI